MNDEATPTVYDVPDDLRNTFRTAFDETEDDQPDTNTACDLFITLHRACAAVQRFDVVALLARITVETDTLALLVIKQVPALGLVACEKMFQIGTGDAVHDIRCVFRDPHTRSVLETGLVEIQFWRAAASSDLRQRNLLHYAPPPLTVDLFAQPLWDAADLHIEGSEFALDRQRILDTLRIVGNMHDVMPVGIRISIDLLYAVDNYAKTNTFKRKRTDERSDGKRRNGQQMEDGVKSSHIGYCVIFQHADGLPQVNAAFMKHLVERVSTIVNWVVVFNNKKSTQSSTSTNKPHKQTLAIALRRNDKTPADVTHFSISGSPWLTRLVEKME